MQIHALLEFHNPFFQRTKVFGVVSGERSSSRFCLEPLFQVPANRAHQAGENPPYGASIHYHLKSELEDSVTLEILDETGAMVRSLKGGGDAGINRLYWDLRHDASKEAKLRASPLHAP